MVGTDTFANSLAMMRCGGASEVSAVSLIVLIALGLLSITKVDGCAPLILLLRYHLNRA